MQGLAPSTRKTYGAASKRFYGFCTLHHILSPFPVCEYTLCCFASHLADEGLSPQTVKSYLSAVRNLHLSFGFPDPRDNSSLPVLKRVLAGISRTYIDRDRVSARTRLPITIHILARIHEVLSHSPCEVHTLIWAIAATAFFGFFRLGELLAECHNPSNLSWGDVAVDCKSSPTMVRIHLHRSKCDQFGRGVDIFLGRTDTMLCPVTAIVEYIRIRRDPPGAFFRMQDGSPASKPWFVSKIRHILSSIGLPQHEYAGHSFRIGAATTAAMVGVEDSMIQTLGRWKSTAFLQYIRIPPSQLAIISRRLSTAEMPQATASSQN